MKYYANILAPFSPLIKKKIEQIREMNLPIEMIAPSHGVIWRKDPMQIIDKYYEWSLDYNEGHAIIIFDTMHNSTREMGKAIAEGLETRGIKVKLFNAANTDQSDLITEVFKAKAVIIGSCTVNNTVLRPTAGLLEEIRGHKFKGKIGAGFGSYGWSGEASKIISTTLEKAGFKVAQPPLSLKYRPDENELAQCRAFGEKIALEMSAL